MGPRRTAAAAIQYLERRDVGPPGIRSRASENAYRRLWRGSRRSRRICVARSWLRWQELRRRRRLRRRSWRSSRSARRFSKAGGLTPRDAVEASRKRSPHPHSRGTGKGSRAWQELPLRRSRRRPPSRSSANDGRPRAPWSALPASA